MQLMTHVSSLGTIAISKKKIFRNTEPESSVNLDTMKLMQPKHCDGERSNYENTFYKEEKDSLVVIFPFMSISTLESILKL